MKQLLLWLWQAIVYGQKEKIEPVIKGYDQLLEHWSKLIPALESRITECEGDRVELWKKIEECEDDRRDLRHEIHGLNDKIEDLDERTSS
jgi:chromosome segregation ATPase